MNANTETSAAHRIGALIGEALAVILAGTLIAGFLAGVVLAVWRVVT